MAEYGYRSPLYGHYGQGCVHLRINFDFRTVEGVRRFREFIDRAADLVLSLGGSLSGEHGDGQARAALLPKMFGPELIGPSGIQGHLDPANRMNPASCRMRCAFTIRWKICVTRVRCGETRPRWRHTLYLQPIKVRWNAPRALRGRGRCLKTRAA